MTVTHTAPAILAPITEQEFLRLPGDGRKFELVDGEAREVPTGFKHDQLIIRMARLMGDAADAYGILVGSQAGFRMRGGNIRCPDLSFTRYERLPNGEAPEGFADFAPDLCIEVISPSEEAGDMRQKVLEYFDAGAQQVWHMFSETQSIRVFTSPTLFVDYDEDAWIETGAILPGFRARVADLFALPHRRPV